MATGGIGVGVGVDVGAGAAGFWGALQAAQPKVANAIARKIRCAVTVMLARNILSAWNRGRKALFRETPADGDGRQTCQPDLLECHDAEAMGHCVGFKLTRLGFGPRPELPAEILQRVSNRYWSSQDSVDGLLPRCMRRLELFGADTPEVAVTA